MKSKYSKENRMTLTERLIELIESKNIDEDDISAASWFMLDAMANIAAGRMTKQGEILTRWFLDEPPNTSRKVLWLAPNSGAINANSTLITLTRR